MKKFLFFLLIFLQGALAFADTVLLHVSFDPTRELFTEINSEFSKQWKLQKGETITIHQSHGGSAKQARSVIEGLDADIVSLALAYDIDVISERAQLLDANWKSRFPHQSTPYTSTVVFLVRKGNPKQIKDWDDLVKPGVAVITPNPKTSGGARWNYLGAWGYALKKYGNNESLAKEFVGKLYNNVPVLDSGARGAATTFVERKIGDVLLTWENEALLSVNQLGADVDIIYPSMSIMAEPPVALVEKNAIRHHTTDAANAYISFLYTPQGQAIIAKHYFRPQIKTGQVYKDIPLFTVDDMFQGWKNAQTIHFKDGGNFDDIYLNNMRRNEK